MVKFLVYLNRLVFVMQGTHAALQSTLLHMKSVNETDSDFLYFMCSVFPRMFVIDFIGSDLFATKL